MNEQGIKYQQARKRVATLRGFYNHLAAYVIVNLGLFLINILTSPQYLWFVWSLMGWGIGVLFDVLRIFSGAFGPNWERKKIDEFIKKQS